MPYSFIQQPEPFWRVAWRNRRSVALGVAGFSGACLAGAFAIVPAFKYLAALFLIIDLLTGGR